MFVTGLVGLIVRFYSTIDKKSNKIMATIPYGFITRKQPIETGVYFQTKIDNAESVLLPLITSQSMSANSIAQCKQHTIGTMEPMHSFFIQCILYDHVHLYQRLLLVLPITRPWVLMRGMEWMSWVRNTTTIGLWFVAWFCHTGGTITNNNDDAHDKKVEWVKTLSTILQRDASDLFAISVDIHNESANLHDIVDLDGDMRECRALFDVTVGVHCSNNRTAHYNMHFSFREAYGIRPVQEPRHQDTASCMWVVAMMLWPYTQATVEGGLICLTRSASVSETGHETFTVLWSVLDMWDISERAIIRGGIIIRNTAKLRQHVDKHCVTGETQPQSSQVLLPLKRMNISTVEQAQGLLFTP